MGIFSQFAPIYWDKGLPVIPLTKNEKIPLPMGWARYCREDIPEPVKAEWLRDHPDGNVGLALGERAGLVAVDLDTDDPRVTQILMKLLPESPWIRRGQKGAVMLYRFNGEKTFRIRTAEGASLLEVLSTGTQIVLPPSIHPKTMQPYVANSKLWEVLDQIPKLPSQVELILRQALVEEGIALSTKGFTKVTEWISVGARDSKMVSVAGLMAKGVMRGERSLFQAVGEMRAWVDNFVEKVAGDNLDPEKAVGKLIEFVKKDVVTGKARLPAGWDDDLSPEEKTKFRAEFGVDGEQWSMERIMDYLQAEFTLHDRGTAGRREAVETALQQIVASESITPMDVDQILNFINISSGKMISMSSLRARLQQLVPVELEGLSHSEIASRALEEICKYGEVRFSGGRFWQWRGSAWEEVSQADLLATVIQDFGNLPAARRHTDHKGIIHTMAALVTEDLRDSPVRGLNFANGFLTSDLQLLPHDPKYGATYVLPYIYDKSRAGACPRFMSFLFQSWGKDEDYKEKIQALREALAVTLFGMAGPFQRAFCVFGVPHSGKSVLIDIVRGLVPPEATCSVPPEEWDDKFLPSMMVGKLANFCGELSEARLIPGDRFKHIVDGGEIAGQHKGQQIFHFKPSCAHWFASNHLPRTRDSSAGFSRRWLFLCFKHAVSSADRITTLANDIVAEEQDAIVAWAVEAMPELMRTHNFTLPKSHGEVVGEMAGINNSVRFFFMEGPVKVSSTPPKGNASNGTWEATLHSAYWAFCKGQAGVRPVSLKIFRQRALELQEDLSFRIDVKDGQGWYNSVTLAENQAKSA